MNTFTSGSIETIFRKKFLAASDVELLWKGDESFRTIFDAVMSAKKIICLEFYIFRNDETGMELAEILKRKSREGVKVYLIYDHFGSFGTPRSFWKNLKGAGIKIRASRPFKWSDPCRYIQRNHRKLIVIDDEKAFTGGLNIANEYSGFHLHRKGLGWRDTGVMLEGPVIKELLAIFARSWYACRGEKIDFPGLPEIAPPPLRKKISKIKNTILKIKKKPGAAPPPDTAKEAQGISVIPVFVHSARGRRRMRRLIYYSINHAQRSISLTTAYFTPSKRMVETLEHAVKRGVQVRLLVSGVSDVPAASYAGKAFFSRLLRAGVEIYTYYGEILHAKTYIFDGCWSIVGSTNLDFQSLRYNDEGNVGILDTGFAKKMDVIFGEDLKKSTRITLEEWRKRPLSKKIKEHFFSLFRRRL